MLSPVRLWHGECGRGWHDVGRHDEGSIHSPRINWLGVCPPPRTRRRHFHDGRSWRESQARSTVDLVFLVYPVAAAEEVR
jgi:hypothetical protein